jgi:hypothetical protein
LETETAVVPGRDWAVVPVMDVTMVAALVPEDIAYVPNVVINNLISKG